MRNVMGFRGSEFFAGSNFCLGIFVFLPALGWLLPNHYSPWTSAWLEAVAIAGLLLLLCVLLLRFKGGVRVSWPLVGMATICGVVPLAQFGVGKLYYFGDALLAVFYVGVWFASVIAGRVACSVQGAKITTSVLCGSWMIVAVISVGIALLQWTEVFDLGIFQMPIPPSERPYANLGQSNNFCTICFLGLCGGFWLYQAQLLGRAAFLVCSSFLSLGMVVSQSRTGVAQVGLLLLLGFTLRNRVGLRASRSLLVLVISVFSLMRVFWPWICEALLLSGRDIADQMAAGVRIPYWLSMLDAIYRQPWFGYGWQQVGIAQQYVALDHPQIGALFFQSHNFILDLLLWNGIPLGAVALCFLVWWGGARLINCHDALVWSLLAAVGGCFVHALLEYPLQYAYFLIPVGLSMGIIEGQQVQNGGVLYSRGYIATFCVVLIAAFLGIASEYLKSEEYYRSYRMESARIGFGQLVTPAPELELLTQLGAFFQFSRTEATEGMTDEELTSMRKVSERFGYPSVMFRYALALGLNGQLGAAQDVLDKLCRVHEKERCQEADEGWAALQSRFPQLVGVKVINDRAKD